VSDPRLDGTRWRLTELNGREPLPRSGITLEFDRWRMLGESGCNTYGADFVARGGRLTLGEGSRGLLTTQIACVPRARRIQETAYQMALGSATGYRLAGDRLELMNAKGETILAFERTEHAPPDEVPGTGTASP
jgi:heat shock protein HslJ